MHIARAGGHTWLLFRAIGVYRSAVIPPLCICFELARTNFRLYYWGDHIPTHMKSFFQPNEVEMICFISVQTILILIYLDNIEASVASKFLVLVLKERLDLFFKKMRDCDPDLQPLKLRLYWHGLVYLSLGCFTGWMLMAEEENITDENANEWLRKYISDKTCTGNRFWSKVAKQEKSWKKCLSKADTQFIVLK